MKPYQQFEQPRARSRHPAGRSTEMLRLPQLGQMKCGMNGFLGYDVALKPGLKAKSRDQNRLAAPSGIANPRCSNAARVATRPRGVRFTSPCWRRYGS